MEKGFYHPSRGYWQTVSEPPKHITDTYPVGTVGVPLKPASHYSWDEAEAKWVAPTAEELAAIEALKAADVVENIKNRFDALNGTDRVLLKIAFLQENRIRLLEGKAEITKEQFRAWVDAQI